MSNPIKKNITRLRKKEITKESFLAKLQIDEIQLESFIKRMFDLAIQSKDLGLVEDTIYMVFIYDINLDSIIDYLNNLIMHDWHEQHENIAMLLQKAKSQSSVDFLYKTINKQYDYLDYDESYALAVKCIWALGDIGNEMAKDKLQKLLDSNNEIIRDNSQNQLERIC